MDFYKKLFLFTILFLSFRSEAKVCVLNFERPESPISKVVLKTYANIPSIEVKVMAMPLDIASCIRDRAEEIVIIGHALEGPDSVKDNTPVSLAYFRELLDEEREMDIKKSIDALDVQISELEKKDVLETRQHKKLLKNLRKAKESYQDFPSDQSYYRFYPILPRAFALARKELASQRERGEEVLLKRVRLMSCLPDQVLAQYKDLTAMIKEQHLELDIAPKNKIMSFLKRKTVTSPNRKWLKKSIVND